MLFNTSDVRVPLNANDIVEISPEQRYIIDKHQASSGFSLIYLAHLEGSDRIVALKELYPRNVDNYFSQRMDNGSILLWNPFADNAEDDAARWEEMKKCFAKEVLLTKKAAIAYGLNGNKESQNNLDVLQMDGPYTDTKGNLYLVIDTYLGQSLHQYIDSGFVKNEDGQVRANQLLPEIIDILIEATIRLSNLHGDENLYHLDLSLDNIYLALAAGKTRYQPYIIDYGSALDRSNPSELYVHRYTYNAFSAPEILALAEYQDPDCGYTANESSDTYSIAAILFYAATGRIFTADLKMFDTEWKDQIKKEYSLGFLGNSEENTFYSKLISFFERGLSASQMERYCSAWELMHALQELKRYYLKYGNLLPLIESDELMSYLVLQKHPLYDFKSDDGDIHVLCLGSGRFIKRMILTLISTGQMISSHLFIHVVSRDSEEDIKIALREAAPLLNDYSNLTRTVDTGREYVTFSFEWIEDILDERVCAAILQKYIDSHYILISLGKNTQNIDVANICAKHFAENEAHCERKRVINYYCSEDAANNTRTSLAISKLPEWLEVDAFSDNLSGYSQTIRTLGIYTLRLAHLYSKLSNPNASIMETAKDLAQDQYSQRSSCAAALHLKYKLASIGIDPNGDIQNLITCYQQALRDDRFGKLLELEHRRWMLSMASEQYTLPTIKEINQYGFEMVGGYFNASWKCKGKKLHPCLVPCDTFGTMLTREDWDRFFAPGKEENEIVRTIDQAQVDPLCKVSLYLHLLAQKRCHAILKANILEDNFRYITEKLQAAREENDYPDNVFDRLQKELDTTQTTVLNEAKQLSYKSDYGSLEHLKKIFEDANINIENEITQLFQRLSVFADYSSWRDYKSADATIINNLLWVLYLDNDINLIKLQSKTVVDNVVAPLMIEPEQTIYVGTKLHSQWEEFLQKHKYAGQISFVSLVENNYDEAVKCLEKIVANNRKKIVIDITGAMGTVIAAAQSIAVKYESVGLIESKQDGTIQNVYNFPMAPIYTLMPAISSNDVFALHGAKQFPQRDNYMERIDNYVSSLWELYEEFQEEWEMITAFFAHPRSSGAGIWIKNYSIRPDTIWKNYTREKVNKNRWDALELESAFQKLEEAGFIKNLSIGEDQNGKTLSFLYPSYSEDVQSDIVRKSFNNLFGVKIYDASTPFKCSLAYSDEKGFTIDIKTESIVDCYCKKNDYSDKRNNNLGVEKRYAYARLEPVLRRMDAKGLITNLTIDLQEGAYTDIKFTYADIGIKRTLVKMGNVLELYVWHQAIQTRAFDDCAANYTFVWEEGVKNEIDVVLTRKWQTLLISCKTGKFNKEHLEEIKCLAEKFSLNSKAVIIYSSQMAVEDGRLTDNLLPIKKRAQALDVYLIDLNELGCDQLGNKLIRIADGLDTP